MSIRVSIIAVVGLAVLGWIIMQCTFVVQQTEQVLLIRLGQPVKTIRDPGLQFKLPFIETYIVYKKQILPLEPPAERIILGDQKRIEVETFSKFRIVDPLHFYQSFGTEEQARNNIAQVVSTALRKHLGTIPLPSLLTADRDRIMSRVQEDVAKEETGNGIEIVNVRLRRADLPLETSQAIYDRMTSERLRQAKELRAQGFERAQLTRAKADRERAVLLSVAQRNSQITRGTADAEANRLVTDAYGQDPQFYDLYRTLQLYRNALTQGSPTIVLSPTSELMRFFEAGPAVSSTTSISGTPSAATVPAATSAPKPASTDITVPKQEAQP